MTDAQRVIQGMRELANEQHRLNVARENMERVRVQNEEFRRSLESMQRASEFVRDAGTSAQA